MPDEVPPFTASMLEAFVQEVNEEAQGSERATILVAAGMLDEMLKRVLVWYLVDDKISRGLFSGPNAPLGTFSSRIKMAFALGLISKSQAQGMEIIRSIRNDYAHKLRPELDRDGVFKRTEKLVHEMAQHRTIREDQLAALKPENIRDQINSCCTLYLTDLIGIFGSRSAERLQELRSGGSNHASSMEN